MRPRRTTPLGPRRGALPTIPTLLALSLLGLGFGAVAAATTGKARAYTHTVAKNESLSTISRYAYGTPRREPLLSLVNGLDRSGGAVIRPGMRLEVPASQFYRAKPGETWPELAERFLGDRARADTLARANQAVAWVPPAEGQEVVVPAVVSHVTSETDTLPELAAKYTDNPNRAWEIDQFNFRKDNAPLTRGELLLIPIDGLNLTREAEDEARHGVEDEVRGATHAVQKRVDDELPLLADDVWQGRYLAAALRGNRLLAAPDLSRLERARLHRALTEAYVALRELEAASASCEQWLALETGERKALLDPAQVSPKIRDVCRLDLPPTSREAGP